MHEDNPEVKLARERGLHVASRAETLAAICASRRLIAVSGTHGKTTTTTLLALVLVEAGLHPSFLIGGDVNEIGTNAVWDKGEWLVVEADESDGTFLVLDPEIAVLTSVEPDHLDYYGGFDKLVDRVRRVLRTRRRAVSWRARTTPIAAEVGTAARRRAGRRARRSADVRIDELQRRSRRRLVRPGREPGTGSVGCRCPFRARTSHRMPPSRRSTALRLGVPIDAAQRALRALCRSRAAGSSTAARRAGVRFVDDYAHLPTEVSAVLEAARSTTTGRVVVVFQPHRYSRTAAVWDQFADSFVGCRRVVVTDVYPAGEEPVPGVTGKLVADAVSSAHPESTVLYVPDRDVARRTGGGTAAPGRPLSHPRGGGPHHASPTNCSGHPHGEPRVL